MNMRYLIGEIGYLICPPETATNFKKTASAEINK